MTSTTASTINEMDNQSDISETTTTAAPTTIDSTLTTSLTSRKPKPVYDYVKGRPSQNTCKWII